jgi:cation diffusion facilitator CzcD-associated flavoprotein CzcO
LKRHKVIIIGSGFGGLGAGVGLDKLGYDDYVILEKSEHPGGTWYHNSYPGAAVDVKSYLYCYSFAPYDWSHIFAEQQEILDYTNHVIDSFGLRPKIKTGKKVAAARWLENEHEWELQCEDGSVFRGKYLINGTGGLHTPQIPTFPGIESFKGGQFHSAEWDHSYDYKGKKVAVIGTGASAVQVVPAIADEVEQLYVLQRTPHWTLSRPDRPFKMWERRLLTKHKWIGKLYRRSIYWTNESRILAFAKFPWILNIFKLVSMANLKKQVKDPELRKKLIPNFTIGCKRVLVTSDYYPTLQKEQVELVTDGIDRFTSNGIKLKNGRELDVDLVIYCTGFKAADMPSRVL